ncbi:DUF4336 domain-containing protein [Devosia sediminis]|uniref:DUF4336 domain-containing protein n=1 Tax=Devosia sediminis TaxID=2798801 RepID=A0A934MLM1_9HYPH|nr:DUF4336 domain-containing protein [Devosia sediminis]MBJ3785310.1 DUF4336 domain-containing protein [Devosia sediminis]
MLQQFGSGIWVHDGGSVTGAMGFHYPTRMAIVRLADGGMLVWSPTALSDALRAAVEALGPVQIIVAPNTLHHTFLGQWQAAFPRALIFGLPALQATRPDLRFDAELGAVPHQDWAVDLDQVLLPATSVMTELVFFHRPSGTVLFTDLLQNLPRDWYSGWRNVIARLDLMTEPEPAVPRKFRMAFGGKPGMRASIEQIIAWPAERVLMAHGTPVTADAPAFLQRAFAWLR